MSHRYRVAFKEVLCKKRKTISYSNGCGHDASSGREITIASSLYNNSSSDPRCSTRTRSLKFVNNRRERNSTQSNDIDWRPEICPTLQKGMIKDSTSNGTNNIIVYVDKNTNGSTKVFTENEVHETLLNQNNETRI
uniref:Uncharacterized protein n=1 Tax=Glossina brevipalpis TaxID=37001 RepID=A0A1A9WP12_9MUSC